MKKLVQWLEGKRRCGGAIMIKTNVQLLAGNDDQKVHQVLTQTPSTAYGRLAAQLISHIHLGIILLDEMHHILEINRAASDLLGLDRNQVLMRTFQEALSQLDLGQDELKRFSAFLHSISDEPKELEVEWLKDGRKYSLSLVAQSMADRESNFKGRMIIVENKSEIRSLEQQVRRNNRLATIGQIAAGTAHEIRNPLTAIKGFLQVIGHKLKESGQQKEHGYIDIMLKEISRISNLVGEFLLLSKPRHLDLRIVTVTKVLREILPIIKNEALLHNVDVYIEKKLSTPPMVVADGELLKQVFLNLTKNAIEAMKNGGRLMIQLSLDSSKRHVICEIMDEGPGIPEHSVDKIFEPFFTTKENGTGLGLPICRQIIGEIGGDIELTSSSEGTKVKVILPLLSS